MLKLLVVDDEPMMRKGLLQGFHWEWMDIQVVGAACNGLEAIEMIRQEQPDIVISDIQMPGMNGLKLADRLKEEYPDIVVIFLTGYSDFEYARHAVELQAAHYLLKPIEEQELFEIMGKVKAYIDNRNRKQKSYEEAEESLRKHMPILRERFLADALRGKLGERELLTTAPIYQVNLTSTYYRVAKIEFSKFKPGLSCDQNEYEMEKNRLIDCFASFFDQSDHIYMASDVPYHWVILFAIENKDQAYNTTRKMLEDCLAEIASPVVRVTIGLSKQHQGVNNLHRCYIEAGEALGGKYNLGSGRVIVYDELVQGDESEISGFHKERLKVLLLSGNRQEVASYLQQYFQLLRSHTNVMVKSKFLVFDLFAAVTDILQVHLSSESGSLDFALLEKMEGAETLEELEQEMAHFLLESMMLVENSRHVQSSRMVEKVIEYLNENYMKDIDLNTIAAHFAVHYSYLSRVFHSKMESSLADYLHNIRMEKAKQLLAATDINVYQISQIVGYRNEKYFIRLFKKRENCTPQQYRIKHDES